MTMNKAILLNNLIQIFVVDHWIDQDQNKSYETNHTKQNIFQQIIKLFMK